jgi:hypothetical protein
MPDPINLLLLTNQEIMAVAALSNPYPRKNHRARGDYRLPTDTRTSLPKPGPTHMVIVQTATDGLGEFEARGTYSGDITGGPDGDPYRQAETLSARRLGQNVATLA